MKYSILKRSIQTFAVLMAVLFAAKLGTATTAVMLTDEDLIASSRVILLGNVQSAKAQWDANHETINTYVKVNVTRILKGQLQNQTIVFKQLGGHVGQEATVIFGAPEYTAGQQVLLFLNTGQDGTLRIAHLFQGIYEVSSDSGQPHARRKVSSENVNIIGPMEGPNITNDIKLSRFVKKINKVLKNNAEEVSVFESKQAAVPIVEIPSEYIDDGDDSGSALSPEYTFLDTPCRWFQPDSGQPVTYRINSAGAPTASGGVTEINQAFAAWTNVPTTSLTMQSDGTTTSGGFKADGVSAISFNDPGNQMDDPVGCSGILALGGASRISGTTRTIGGRVFNQIIEGDVVFNNNFSCFLGISANLAEVATHELGHTLGFGHSADANAIMYAYAHGNGRGATLGTDDIAAVTFLYPGSKSTTPPPAVPTAPSGLAAVAASSSSINLVWADNSSNETGFRLERKIGVSGTYALITSPAANQTSFTDTGLQASTTYYYRIKAFNGTGESAYSNEAQTTTLAGTTPPPNSNNATFVTQSVPTSLAARATATVSVTLHNSGTTTWTAGTYFLGSQNPQDNTTWGLNRVSLPSSVAPGANATFTFTITAPATAGTYNFQWKMLQSGVGYFGAASTNVAITVSGATTPLKITTTAILFPTRGVAYSQQITATGGRAPYTWSATGTLPTGVTLNASTGLLSGTPSAPGTFSFTVTVRDANSSTASQAYKVAVR